MKSFKEFIGGLMGGKPKDQGVPPVDPTAQRLNGLAANLGNVTAQAEGQGITATPAATPDAAPAQPAAPVVAEPAPVK